MKRQRLDSWKSIAAYLNCAEKTARRREQLSGLPVHRPAGTRSGVVYAFTDELDAWLAQESVPAQREEMSPARRPFGYWVTAISTLTIVLTGVWWTTRRDSLRLTGATWVYSDSPAPKLTPLLMDRRALYYQEQGPTQGRFRLIQVPLDGQPPVAHDVPLTNPDPGVVSSDGSMMLLRDITRDKNGDEPLYRVYLPTGPAIRLGEILAYDSAWTPDERNIIFSRDRSVYLTGLRGNSPRKLFDTPGRAYAFRWNPDGKHFRYSVYDAGSFAYRIFEATLGNPPAEVSLGSRTPPQRCCGRWSANGRFYFFEALIDGFSQLMVHQAGHSESHVLTRGLLNNRSPLPSADGRRLFYLTQMAKSEVVERDPSTGRWLPLLDGGPPSATAVFSPDGRWLAHTRPPGYGLWVCAMPGCTSSRRLTAEPWRVTMPRWSPDGMRLAFMRRIPGQRWQVAVVQRDGGAEEPIPAESTGQADPDWLPGPATRLVYGSVPLPGSDARQGLAVVTLPGAHRFTLVGSDGLQSPAVAPGGHHLAAVHAETRQVVVLRISSRIDRLEPGPVVPSGHRAGYLHWVSASELRFLSIGPPSRIMAFDPASGILREVATLASLRQPSFSLGDWVGAGPGGRPLALRDLSTDQVVSAELDFH